MSLLPPKAEVIENLSAELPKKRTRGRPPKHAYNREKEAALIEMELHPGVYDVEKIKNWIRLGVGKPLWIPDEDWNSVKLGQKPIQGVICHLAAMAMANEDIAVITGTSLEFVAASLKSVTGKAEVQRVQDLVWGDNFKKIIQAIVPIAIQTAFNAMTDPKTKSQTKVDAAFKFMDRAMGKPTQQIEINDNLIRSVFEKLDAETGKVIDITQVPQTALTNEHSADTVKNEDLSLDTVDNWVRENL